MADGNSAQPSSRPRVLAGLAAIAFFALAAGTTLPVSLDGDGLANNTASARGNGGGGGNGGGNGGGRGNGRGDGHDTGRQLRAAGADHGDWGSGNAAGHRHAPGQSRGTQTAAATSEAGQLTAKLGSLNAAHAAPAAFENASGNSVIGALRDYMDSLVAFVFGGDDQHARDAAGALQRAANKDALIDPAVIDAVNALLDGKSGDFSHENVAGNPVHESEDDIFNLIDVAS